MKHKEEKLIVLGEELRRMRVAMGLSQEKMAEQLGTDFRVISRYENGHAEPGVLLYLQVMSLYAMMMRDQDRDDRTAALSPETREMIGMLTMPPEEKSVIVKKTRKFY